MPSVLKNLPIGLLIFLLVMFGLNLGGYLLFDHDEGAFSEATRGMFERGDFITTMLNDRLRFDKPILIYWLQAVSISLFGTEVWAFRLPSAMAGLIWALGTFVFTREYLGRNTAIAAAMMCASALGINMICHVATADALLNALLASTLLLIYHYSVHPSKLALYGIYTLMGLGLLTKGPVAVAIPLLVVTLYYVWAKRYQDLLRALFFVPGWILMLAIAAPWYILEYQAQGQAFIDGFFLKHNVNRFNNAMEGHDGGFLFYPMVLPFVLAPFGALLLKVVPSVRGIIQADGLNRFLWIWFLVVLILFSLASTKLPHYILYGCTPLIILMARYRFSLRHRWLAALLPLFFFAVMLALPLLIPLLEQRLTNPIEIATAQRAGYFIGKGFAISAAVCGILAVALILWRRLAIWQALTTTAVLQAWFLWFVVAPAISDAQQQPVYDAAMFARKLNEPVITQSIDMPSFNVYLDKVTPRRPLQPGEVGFGRIDRLRDLDQYDILFQSGLIVIIRAPLLNKPAQLSDQDQPLQDQPQQSTNTDSTTPQEPSS